MKHLTYTPFILTIIIFSFFSSCQKKSNSRTGDESSASTVTTTSGQPSTTGGTPTLTIPTGGTPTCTLNSMQVICGNYFPSLTLSYSSNSQSLGVYSLSNYAGNYNVLLYFEGTNIPISGTYSVTPNSPVTNPGFGKVGVRLTQGTSPEGYGQSGFVYVVNTGANVSATFCDVPVSIYVDPATTYTTVVSAKIVK
jgi:hypothetical protein